MSRAWLQGPIEFGSTSSFIDLKIGPNAVDIGRAIRNVDGATGTSFTRCHFRGGGLPADPLLRGTRSSSWATAAMSPTSPSPTARWNARSATATSTSWAPLACRRHRPEHHLRWLPLRRQQRGRHRIGSDDGRDLDGPRRDRQNVTFTGCEFEPSDNWCLDFACYQDSVRASGVLVEDCIFHRAGGGPYQAAAITLEWPDNVVIRNNHFNRCKDGAVYSAGDFMGTNTDTYWRITGNTFDWDTARNGITMNFAPISSPATTTSSPATPSLPTPPSPSGPTAREPASCSGATGARATTTPSPATPSTSTKFRTPPYEYQRCER